MPNWCWWIVYDDPTGLETSPPPAFAIWLSAGEPGRHPTPPQAAAQTPNDFNQFPLKGKKR